MASRATPETPAGPASATRRARLAAQLAALLLGLGCAATCAQWGLRILRQLHAPAPPAAASADLAGLAAQAAGVFGATRRGAVAPGPRRFALQGVIGGGSLAGAALIGIDGKPPQAFAVGAEVAPGVRLVDTAFGSAVLSRDGGREVLHTRPPAARAASGARAAAPGRPPEAPGIAAPTLVPRQAAFQPAEPLAPRPLQLEQRLDPQGGPLEHRRFEGP